MVNALGYPPMPFDHRREGVLVINITQPMKHPQSGALLALRGSFYVNLNTSYHTGKVT